MTILRKLAEWRSRRYDQLPYAVRRARESGVDFCVGSAEGEFPLYPGGPEALREDLKLFDKPFDPSQGTVTFREEL